MTPGIHARKFYVLVALLVLVVDRATKVQIQNRFDLYDSISVIDGFFDITYVHNTGVAFGLFSSTSSAWQAAILSLFTLGAIIFVGVYSMRSAVTNRLLQYGLVLILGGALGNLYDRIRFGYVIDFLEFYVGAYRWPTFNVADTAISIGVLLLALEMFRGENLQRA